MKNVKKIYLTIFLFLFLATAVSAQRWHREGGYRHYDREYWHRPTVRAYVGIGNIGYRPYYRPSYYYGYRRPSIGVVISVLPVGFRTFYLGPDPYYYYGGAYYRPYNNNHYEVIDAPVGARIPELPAGAKVEVINGQKFYQYDGNYYKEVITDKGEILYEVVGKNAVLNTNEGAVKTDPAPSTEKTVVTNEAIGKETEKLPDNSKTIVINQQKYFQSPSGYYYQEVIKDNKISYKIVGKVSEAN
ncbi:MAG: hypothetical protein HYR66_16615 [Sphingobacteriales bacterium]|nr:hypothetical protein [Sphingobacteriales bacterium]MBI3717752.1 hypothetical protein [Sphingobacteriales bacterium]